MFADSRNGAILPGDYFLWYRRRSGGVFQPGWVLSQALESGCFSSSERIFIRLFVGFFELWETWNLLCQFLGLDVAVLDVDQRVIDFLLDDVMTPYAWLRKFFRRFFDYAKAISCRPSQRLESNRHVFNAERHRE